MTPGPSRSGGPAKPLLLRVLDAEPAERTPVWAMRQAGRWDPEFRKLRSGLDFYTFSENAELSAQASLAPLRFGVDAVILFYDITTLSVAMGQRFDLVKGRGPVPKNPIRSTEEASALSGDPDPERYRHVLEILRLVRQEVGDSVAVLVFAGAPFTMASYQLGLGREIDALRFVARDRPRLWGTLLERTGEATISFLKRLLDAGADAYQLFDTWAGGLSPLEYDAYCHRYHREIFRAVGGRSILFVKDSHHLERGSECRAKAISLGAGDPLGRLQERWPSLVVQGNVDHRLLVDRTPDEVAAATRRCLQEGRRGRHILNLDHGMVPDAKVECFEAFCDAARSG